MVKHNSLAHFALTAALFYVSVKVLGGGVIGLLFNMSAQAGAGIALAQMGDLSSAGEVMRELLPQIMLFVINLIAYYLISAILIAIINVIFVRNKKSS